MKISRIYKSKSPYQWESGKHKTKAHLKALEKLRKQRRKKPKVSAMGWKM
jgi:hypothetical protein